jgi:enoyl-CoA hydratase/carnithine racemase
MPTPIFSGLVDYVSGKDKSALDRALTLAEEIAANGTFISFCHAGLNDFFKLGSEAPLALRSAKLAISRALELSLEPGELRPLTAFLSLSRAFCRPGLRKSRI